MLESGGAARDTLVSRVRSMCDAEPSERITNGRLQLCDVSSAGGAGAAAAREDLQRLPFGRHGVAELLSAGGAARLPSCRARNVERRWRLQ